ncbi:hypothetical protein ACQ4PT_002645 [Festuca glaucescens]
MGAVLSSAAVADAAKAYKNIAQPRLIAPDTTADDHDDEYDYWSALPDDLLVTIMAGLDIQSLRRSGAVCTSWRHAHGPFRLPALEQVPCLLYACEEAAPRQAGLHLLVPGGWMFTTDEVGDPYLLNPLTGVQAKLPPVKTIYNNDTYYDDDGKHVWEADVKDGSLPSISWARHVEYLQVAVSTAAEVTECTVLIVHMPEWRVSFARPGDTRWTLLSEDTNFVGNILYNDRDGLLYILYINGSISTLDLTGPSPLVTTIMDRVIRSGGFHNMYLVHGPSGELLQIIFQHYQDIVKEICENCAELAGEPDNEDKLSEKITNDNEDEHYEDEHYEAVAANQEIDVSQLLREGIDLPHRLVDEVTTIELLVFKVDIKRKKLVELRDHAFFLGHNSAVCLPTQDFPAFEPNCAYLTDDCFDYSPMLRKDLGVWNIKKTSMQKLGEAWPNLHPWLHLPPPI